MLSGHERDGERTSSVIMKYSVYLSTVPFVSTFTGVTSSMFALEGIVLNSYALWVANRFRMERTNTNARKVFLTSLWYLPCWLMLFLLHSKVWDEDHDRDVLRDAVSNLIHSVRSEGRKICLHEQIAVKSIDTESQSACPVVITKKSSEIIQNMRPHFPTEFQKLNCWAQNESEIIKNLQNKSEISSQYATSFSNGIPKAQLLGPKQVRNDPKYVISFSN